MKKYLPFIRIAVLCLFLSIAAHAVYLVEWTGSRFMLGPNDGLSQMLPFKSMLYEQYTSGEFFYSPFFGLGGDTYSGLAYYFSTSIVFALTVGIFYLLELSGIIAEPDLLFWAHAAVFINIARLAAALFIAYLVFRYMKFDQVPSFLGAAVYGLSSMYFRHAVYWEFYADAYLWLPLLIFGIEKVFREKRPGWFIAAVAISMIDNFYFAYINFLLAGIYILFRLFMPLEEKELKKSNAVILFLLSGLIGAGISAVSFVPALYGFLNNHRPAYVHDSEWLAFHDNILFTSSYFILPAAFVGMVFAFPFFRDPAFRFYAALVLFCIVLHYSPQIASVFNGFSAPQYRWEYFLSFTAGGAVAAGFSQLALLKLKDFTVAGGMALLVYGLFALADERLPLQPFTIFGAVSGTLLIFVLFALAVKKNSIKGQAAVIAVMALAFLAAAYQFLQAVAEEGVSIQMPLFLGILGSALFTFMLLLRAIWDHSKRAEAVAFIVFTLLVLANGFQYLLLVKSGNTEEVSEQYITSEEYDDPEIRALLSEIQEREAFPFYRIDWMEGIRNNTPMVQDFHGLSAYSSILNEEVLHFYLSELEIDMGRESVSRYATLGKRANLHSLLLGNYAILSRDDENVPAGFEPILTSEHYIVYENQLPLPFLRSTSNAYSEESLAAEPVLRREHAMLSGVVLINPEEQAQLPQEPEELAIDIIGVDASFEDGILDVTGESGGIDLVLKDSVPAQSDLYVAMNLFNLAENQRFTLHINSYKTSRKSNVSIYKTFVDDLTIRVPADDTVRIRLPQGTYNLTELAVYEEPYDLLRAEASKAKEGNSFEWNGSRIRADYSNEEGDQFIVLPVPYEIGWTAEVNGEKAEVLEANYAFLAVPAAPGLNEIILTYRPPHFWKSLMISVISLFGGAVYLWRRRI
ncbi:YfhO family protein [Planococcus sp. APC 3906]|uniref:YfhO family protein n=1 Tax=Planococcus sp. APC 3906 TaxID=3035194 RepID=UPI0025B5E6D3|nr:YfhO family protein [Planococcus sp. APC 3906]MDN3450641.1 YfhO family protein [Planococcus sp. APC 3906]